MKDAADEEKQKMDAAVNQEKCIVGGEDDEKKEGRDLSKP